MITYATRQIMQVPYTAGREVPAMAVPVNACDCHHHIYDPVRFPYVPTDVRNQPPAGVDVYRMLQKRLGLTRNVIIQPSAYGLDNRCTLDALAQMGANARAVVVIDDTVSDEELEAMHAAGVRGVRFNIATGGSDDLALIERIACRIHELGWHVQFWMSAGRIAAMKSFFQKLPCPIVFDHLAHLPQPEGSRHPAFGIVTDLMKEGRGWIKLSGFYLDSQEGYPDYGDTAKTGAAFIRACLDRCVWGSDWPHPSVFSKRKTWPDDAVMLASLAGMGTTEEDRYKILVTNPEILYGF